MSFDRLAEAVTICQACPLGVQGRGVPGTWSGGQHSAPDGTLVMILGEAPGAVEMAQGKPFVGQSGELLHSMLQEVGLTSYYISNLVKHQPFKDKGKQLPPDKVAIEACAPFLRAEFDLVRPTKLILLGKTSAKFIVEGNFSMKDVVNTTFSLVITPGLGASHPPTIPTLILYHPAYFLRQRTAPWIQKQIADWKRAVRMFLGDRPPTYRIERVECPSHPPILQVIPFTHDNFRR